jgi:hypothetical protein
MESEMKPNELRVLTKEFLQKHLGYPDETAYKLSDELLASIHSLLLEGAPEDEIKLWVSVNLMNGKYFPIKYLKETFDAKLFYKDFCDMLDAKWRTHIKKVIGE